MATMGWETAAKAMEAVLGEMAPRPAPARPQPRDRAPSSASKDLLRLAQWKAAGLAERACSLGVVPRARATVHLGVVLAGWDPGRTAVSLEILNRRLSNLDSATWTLVVVANNQRVRDYLRGSLSAQMRMVKGSNDEGEFSAYEEGSQALIADAPTSPAAWIIANDRLPAYGTRYVDAVSPGLLRFTATNAVASGHVDDESRGVPLWGYRLSSYIRSNWLFISAEALARLGPLRSVTVAECDRHVPLDFPGERWPFSEWLGEAMGEWLRAWLVEPGYWTRAAPLTPASWPLLRSKALAMVNEQLLSARLVRAGVPLVPWHQARLLARLPPEGRFAQQLLQLYKDHLDFGFGAEENPLARLQLAGGVFAARAGLWLAGTRLLAAARRSSELALENMT